MNWFTDLLFGGGIAHSVFVLALVIAAGIALGKFKIKGVSLGITWILFVGIIASHFGMCINADVLEFAKEFGLILFIYSIGLQVGPGFFASFKKGGFKLVGYSSILVLLGVAVTVALHFATGTPMPTMVGIMQGAVTDTSGLGAAQQALLDSTGRSDSTIAMGYAVAYPLGVVGVILTIILIKGIFRIKYDKETEQLAEFNSDAPHAVNVSIELTNSNTVEQSISSVQKLLNRPFVISRIRRKDGHIEIASAESLLEEGDKLFVVCDENDKGSIVAFLGRELPDMSFDEWRKLDSQLVSRRVLVTRPEINGKNMGQLRLRSNFGVNVTRVHRAGVELIVTPKLELQMGDRLTAVGTEAALETLSNYLGNSMKRLREPNLITLFVGIFLGVLLGSLPIAFPGMPQPVKLGFTGGPLIVAILISRFGPHFNLITYTTLSANLMVREIGISLFLACVGLGAGENFVETVVGGGYMWILYGFLITVIPVLVMTLLLRGVCKMNFFTLTGLASGTMMNPIALAYINSLGGNDQASVTYSTVYPFAMFLRVLFAQMLILFTC